MLNDCLKLHCLKLLSFGVIRCMGVCQVSSAVSDSSTLWTTDHQASLSVGFSWQGYWRGSPCPPPGVLPHPGLEPTSLTSPAFASRFFTTSVTWEALTQSESEVAQLCPTLCNPMDYSLPGPSIHGIFQARVLDYAAMPSSRGSSQPKD